MQGRKRLLQGGPPFLLLTEGRQLLVQVLFPLPLFRNGGQPAPVVRNTKLRLPDPPVQILVFAQLLVDRRPPPPLRAEQRVPLLSQPFHQSA